ncbi:Beta-galactosidase [Cucumis melo var. makuwa]|uniref:Beta-galactosidase n=1 Tax=Cucumis melo var. makuwa TaxID=1194695 RepID=A0A5D3DTN8_CUCMM|nr:Beta-galactosidase [Cucumis melo var. makuwa]
MGVVPQSYVPPSDQKVMHAPPVSGAWTYAPPPFHVTAQPVPFYAPSDVQLSNPSSHPHPHAPVMSSGQQPSTVNLSNLYSKHPLYVDSLQQPLFSGNGIDQPQNRSDIEAGESSMHSKPTELPMYSKNPVTLFPNLPSNYITGSLGLNPKFDNVCGRILRQRPFPSLMEVCFEVRLEEDRTNAMGVLTTLPLTPLPLALGPQIMTVTRIVESQILCVSTARNNGTPRISVGNFTVVPQEIKTPTLGAITQSGMPQSLGLISVDGKNPWILDSGATDHLTGSSEHFISYAPCAGNKKIRIADGSLTPITGKGQIVPFDGFALQNVLHVPKLSYNLLSISKITRKLHCKVIFLPELVYYQDMSSGRTIGTARHSRGLYILDDDTSCSSLSTISSLSSYFSTSEQDCMLWHFPHLFSKLDVSSLSCDVCIQAKQHRVSFPSQSYKPTQPFILIHSDVWGPSKVTTPSGKRWFVTFIDDHTRLTWVYLITDKSEVPSIFQNFYHTIKTQFHTKIAILQSDSGREFQNHNLSEFLASKGIVHQTSSAYTPQQNGVAERKNHHLVEVARSLMLSISFPSYMWGDVILTTAHLINRMSSRILYLQTPLDCLKESYPSTRLVYEVPLRVFGCTAYVHNFGPNQTKFTPRAQACVFVGYPLHQRASKGIVHQTSSAYTPQQNGVAERKNHHLVEVARSLMLSISFPSYMWGDVILTTAHLINRMSSRILYLQTPLDCLKESYPSTRLVYEVPLRVFGCTAYVHNFGPNQTKFTPRAQACVFVGYPLHQRGYKCFHPPSRKCFVTMDVTFCENQPYFPVSHLQGESVNEVEFVEFTPITVSDIDPDPIILPTNQVPWKTY